MNKKILVLSERNDCRSQMAEGILKSLDKSLEVFSAGTDPSNRLNPLTILAMDEMGIDIRGFYPKKIDDLVNRTFDIIITLCEKAKVDCNELITNIHSQQHYRIKHPLEKKVGEEELLDEFRKARDKIYSNMFDLYMDLRKN